MSVKTTVKLGSAEFEKGIKTMLRGDVTVNGETFKRGGEWVPVPDYFVVAVNEFLSDWQKGDFSLESYALYDAQSILSAKERWAAELALKQPA